MSKPGLYTATYCGIEKNVPVAVLNGWVLRLDTGGKHFSDNFTDLQPVKVVPIDAVVIEKPSGMANWFAYARLWRWALQELGHPGFYSLDEFVTQLSSAPVTKPEPFIKVELGMKLREAMRMGWQVNTDANGSREVIMPERIAIEFQRQVEAKLTPVPEPKVGERVTAFYGGTQEEDCDEFLRFTNSPDLYRHYVSVNFGTFANWSDLIEPSLVEDVEK